MDTKTERVEFLKRAIEHAPVKPATTPPSDLAGWWLPCADGHVYVCVFCAGRLLDRGASITPAIPCYTDTGTPGECVTCESQRATLAPSRDVVPIVNPEEDDLQ